MNYTLFLFLFLIGSHYLNELVLIPFLLFFGLRKQIKIKLRQVDQVYFIAVILLILYSFIQKGLKFDIGLCIHFLLLFFLVFFIKDEKFSLGHLLIVIKSFLIFSLLIFLYNAFLNDFQFGFIKALSIPRFQGIFREPSIASFNFLLFGVILFSYDKAKISFWVLLCLFFILVTFSGSGYILLLITALSYIKFKITKRRLLITLSILIVTSLVSIALVNTEGYQKLVSKRLSRVSSGDDNSSKLRFLAPLQAAEFTMLDSPAFGFGIGTSESVIDENRSFFTLFELFDGEETTKVNNIYALIILYGGFFLIAVHFLLIYSLGRKINYENRPIYVLFLFFPFFSGFYVDIFFWFLVYFIRHTQNNSLQSNNGLS